jgi:hypothetical protein
VNFILIKPYSNNKIKKDLTCCNVRTFFIVLVKKFKTSYVKIRRKYCTYLTSFEFIFGIRSVWTQNYQIFVR